MDNSAGAGFSDAATAQLVPLSNVRAVAAGGEHSLFVTTAGEGVGVGHQ